MRNHMGRVIAASLFPVLAFHAFGQIGPQIVQTSGARLGVVAAGCSANREGQQFSRPPGYTAEFTTTSTQTLANGVTITHVSTEIQAVDSQGRSMNSRTEAQFSADQPAVTWGNVNNPVENTQINWNSQTREAQVIKMPLEAQRQGCWRNDSGSMTMSFGPDETSNAPPAKIHAPPPIHFRQRSAREPQREDLGTTMIQGVEAQGYRSTTTIPVGQIGNDKELVVTEEQWVAPSVGLVMRSVRDDPQQGKTVREVVNLDLSEPPLSTFQPPEGYEVTTEEMRKVPCNAQGAPGFAGFVSSTGFVY